MNHFSLVIVLIVLLSFTNRGKKEEFANKATDAQVIGFVTEKCFCCWGWVIKVGTDTIKSEQIPTLNLSEGTVFTINRKDLGYGLNFSEFSIIKKKE